MNKKIKLRIQYFKEGVRECREVEAYQISEHFAIWDMRQVPEAPRRRIYSLTHIPTGTRLESWGDTRKHYEELAPLLEKVEGIDWDQTDIAFFWEGQRKHRKIYRKVLEILASM